MIPTIIKTFVKGSEPSEPAAVSSSALKTHENASPTVHEQSDAIAAITNRSLFFR